MKKLSMTLFSLCLASALTVGASAAEPLSYDVDGPGDPEYGKPTSVEVVYTADGGAMKNEDVSKNAALIPPAFGSPSADALNTGTYLTPNLAPNGQPTGGAVINGTGSAVVIPGSPVPSAPSSGSPGTASTGYTEVTDDLYYKGGHLGTLKIPAIDLTVKVYEGTGSSTLAKGAGHFEETSIWDGNVAFAAVRPDRA